MYLTNISLIFFLNHNDSTDTAERCRLPVNPLQVQSHLLLLQQEAHNSRYGLPLPCFLDCLIDPYIILYSPFAAILDRNLTCQTQF
jgi:hypothetical protein